MGKLITRQEVAKILGLSDANSLPHYARNPLFPKDKGRQGMNKMYDRDEILLFKSRLRQRPVEKERNHIQMCHASGTTGENDERDIGSSPCMWTDFIDGSFNQIARGFLIEHGNRLLALQKECQALEIY